LTWEGIAGDLSSAGGCGSSLTKTDRSTRIFAASVVARISLPLKFLTALLLPALLLASFASTSQAQLRQDKLYIDDGTGLFTIIKSMSLSGAQTIKFPNAGGTDGQIVIMKSPFDASNAWQAGDLLFAATTGNSVTRLPAGVNGKVLTIVGGSPQWADPFTTGGTVTSVDITVPSFLSVTGGPITTSGTFDVTLADQTGNKVFSSPADGSSGPPTFRTLVPSDIPNLSASQITSGVLSVAQGGTGLSSLAAALIAMLPDTTNKTLLYLQVKNGGGFRWNDPTAGVQSFGVGNPLAINAGGTGQSTRAAAIRALLPDTTNNTSKFLQVKPGGGIDWTPAVTSITGSGGTTGLTLTGGPITTTGTLTLDGTLGIANGGTGQTTALAALNALVPDTTSHTDQYLHVMPGGGFDWSSPSGGGGGGSVTSVSGSGGTTGLTLTGGPITTSGTLTLGGTLAETNGGTGQSTYSTGDLLYASAPNTLSKLTIGGTNQVLGTSGGVPAWIQNGATITNAVNTPASAVGDLDNYPIDGSSTYIRLSNTSAGSINLTGMSNAGVDNGREITLVNIGTNGIIVKHQSSQSSVGNRFDLPGASEIILGPRGTATFIYDQAAGFWELVSTN
jgi:hypothetical protein